MQQRRLGGQLRQDAFKNAVPVHGEGHGCGSSAIGAGRQVYAMRAEARRDGRGVKSVPREQEIATIKLARATGFGCIITHAPKHGPAGTVRELRSQSACRRWRKRKRTGSVEHQMQIKVQEWTALLVVWMREDEEKTQREGSRGKAACLLRRAQTSVSKKLLQVADKIESDAPYPRAIATTLCYECILT